MPPRVLIAYATTHGHTGRIAARVAERLAGAGLDANLRELPRHGDRPSAAGYDVVAVGASLHRGRHQEQVVEWLREQRDALAGRPAGLFSVSLTAADDTDEARADTRRCIGELLDATGFRPDLTVALAGAFQYREYDVFTRSLMRLIARRHGITTDVRADVELTDWDAVDRFADELATRARAAEDGPSDAIGGHPARPGAGGRRRP
jgi:menaquinone-dependent protoporphyrinogen oxidase